MYRNVFNFNVCSVHTYGINYLCCSYTGRLGVLFEFSTTNAAYNTIFVILFT